MTLIEFLHTVLEDETVEINRVFFNEEKNRLYDCLGEKIAKEWLHDFNINLNYEVASFKSGYEYSGNIENQNIRSFIDVKVW